MRVLTRVILLIVLAGTAVAAPQTKDVLVFAASSLQTALDDLAGAAERATGLRLKVSYAASSALARQIENGAPAEIFISADLDWMDYLAERRLIRPESRRNLLGNRLVLIAPKGARTALTIEKGFGLAGALGRDRLARANPDVVAAGQYARPARTSLGGWDSVSNIVAATENVRAALALVSRGEAPLGIVYRTDALVDAGVTVIGTFPESAHPPITYPAALMPHASAGAVKVLAFLTSPAARSIFERHGFSARD